MGGFAHRGKAAAFVLCGGTIRFHLWKPRVERGRVWSGVALVVVGLASAASGTLPGLSLGAVGFGAGGGLLFRGLRPHPMMVPARTVASTEPARVWPPDVPIDWNGAVRIHADGETIVVRGALPHRRGLRRMLEQG